MIAKVKSFILAGIDAVPVTVECQVSPGLGIHIVGVPDQSVKECLLRSITAMQSLGYSIPGKKIVINITPKVDASASGVEGLDLPVALAMLAASGKEMPHLEDTLFAGELALDGKVRALRGGFSAGLLLKDLGSNAALPKGTAGEALYGLQRSRRILRIDTLRDAVAVATDGRIADKFEEDLSADGMPEAPKARSVPEITPGELRILEIAAAGGFDLYLTGETDEHKDVLISAFAELACTGGSLDTLKVQSVCGRRLSTSPTVQHVPHVVSLAAIVGGGPKMTPGYVSLCHDGVLVMDNPREWGRSLRETLSAVHHDKKVTIKRLSNTYTYPADFRLVIDGTSTIGQGDAEDIKTVLWKMADVRPLWLHIDHTGQLPVITAEQWLAAKQRVEAARMLQWSRNKDGLLNADMNGLAMYHTFDSESIIFLDTLSERLDISSQHLVELIAIAQTIADIDGTSTTNAKLAEAASYIPKGKNDKS